MAKRLSTDVGTRVERKRDKATGAVIARSLAVPSVSHPGIYGKTIVTIRLDNADWNRQAGGDQVGDLMWFRSNFK